MQIHYSDGLVIEWKIKSPDLYLRSHFEGLDKFRHKIKNNAANSARTQGEYPYVFS